MSNSESNIGDRNVERLVGQAYQPENADPALLPRVTEQMCASGAARPAEHVAQSADGKGTGESSRLLPMLMGMAAVLAGLFVIAHALFPPHGHKAPRTIHKAVTPLAAGKTAPPPAADFREILKPRPRPAVEPIQPAAVGNTLTTGAGQRRRFGLSDGSVVYLNQNTKVQITADRRLNLEQGEVFIEVNPQPQGTGNPFIVKTPRRDVTALGTKFAVRTDTEGRTGVVVTQGKVQVSGYDRPLVTGQQLELGKDASSVAPRTSYVLDWTRDLMIAADSPLVPESKYAGGTLVAVDPQGQEAKLNLRNYHVDVYIEDGFARTVIDQTYFNNANLRMEGTFYFPLPADASLSRLAMYVDGELMEGGMAERDYARGVYEEILHSQRDPALLEWVDGSTFKMRVFPLEARQEKRIIIGYTQRLSSLYGRAQYRFPAGHSLGVVDAWSLRARIKNGKDLVVSSESHPSFKLKQEGKDILIEGKTAHTRLDQDVILNIIDPLGSSGQNPSAAHFSTATHEGSRYVMLRYQPELQVQKQRQHRDWVFLFESSGDRDPLLARAQIEVIRNLLQNAEHYDTFAVVTAGTRTQSFQPHLVDVTPANVQSAIAFLESAHLVGALDLNLALSTVEPLLKAGTNPYLVHVGSGTAALGEHRADVLAKKIPQGAHYVGVGVGKRWNRQFMKTAAESTGGYFTQVNPDEPISWRAFDLAATLNTPRLMDIKVLGTSGKSNFLLMSNYLAQGEELCAIARFGTGEQEPRSLRIIGSVDGEAFQQEIQLPVHEKANVEPSSVLPRTWARLEIDRMLAEDAAENRNKIVALSKQMYVMTPFTSLLVLENDEMYQRFKVDRGRKDHWAPYVTPKKIDVKYEPEVGQAVDARFAPKTAKPHVNEILQTILIRTPASILTWPDRGQRNGRTTTALQVYRGAFALPSKNRDLAERLGDVENDPHPVAGDDAPNFNIDRINRLERVMFMGGRADKESELREMAMPEQFATAVSRGTTLRRRGLESSFREAAASDAPAESTFLGFAAASPSPMSPSFGFQIISAGNDVTRQNVILRQIPQYKPLFAANIFDLDAFMPFERGRMQQDSFGGQNAARSPELEDRRKRVAADQLMAGIIRGSQNSPRMYSRPSFSHDERVFSDLTAYAPGLNTSQADIEAVIEAEAQVGLNSLPGTIDPAAKPLIDGARSAGWQTLTIPANGGQSALPVIFDGQGRYVFQRTTPLGLREEVVCDGTTLLHLYPELGIGSRRQVSRFHRYQFAELVPWLLPPIEDLARGADVKKIGDRTVALIPRGADKKKDDDGKPVGYGYSQLRFDTDGRLLERRIVEVSYDKESKSKETVLFRETYSTAGVVQLYDKKDKAMGKARELKLTPAVAPSLTPDVTSLVVLPLPWRSQQHAYAALDINPNILNSNNENWTLEYLNADQALALLATEFAQSDSGRYWQIQRRCFIANGNNKLGLYVLLAALNMPFAADAEFQQLLQQNPTSPLARYLALQGNPLYRRLQERWGLNLGEGIGPEGNFFQRLASFQDLRLHLQYVMKGDNSQKLPTPQFDRGLAYVSRNKHSIFGWAMLSVLEERAYNSDLQSKLAGDWKLYIDDSELGYIARYEHARSLLHSGKEAEAAKLFRDLYEQMLKHKVLPPIDGSFRTALVGNGKGPDSWNDLMRKTAQLLLKDNHRQTLVKLAWQCWQLGDAPLAENMLTAVLTSPANATERLQVTVAAVDYLLDTNQVSRADTLVAELLTDADFAKRPALWRLASLVAQRRSQTVRSIGYLEKALDLEFQDLPPVINLQQVRQDYGRLLEHYQWLADAVGTLKIETPPDLGARTIRAADRWRSMDRDNGDVCDKTARILKMLGARDMAWEYMTTPIGMRPSEAGPWRTLAGALNQQGELELANRAYQAAFDADPTNPQTLWDQAQNLDRAGKKAEADLLRRRIVDGQWQDHYSGLKAQARWQMEGR